MKIRSIDSKKMILEDDREYEFMGANPPPSSWQIGDDVYVDKRGEKIKSDMAINRTKKNQERLVSYLRGGISKGHDPKVELGEGYPDKWLDQDWRIKDLLVEDGLVLVDDPSPNGSKWKPGGLVKADVGKLEQGQAVQISKGSLGVMKTYRMKISNTDIPPYDVSFMGWQKSQL